MKEGVKASEDTMTLEEQKLFLLDAYSKLAVAESQVQEGNILDADEELKCIRADYNV